MKIIRYVCLVGLLVVGNSYGMNNDADKDPAVQQPLPYLHQITDNDVLDFYYNAASRKRDAGDYEGALALLNWLRDGLHDARLST